MEIITLREAAEQTWLRVKVWKYLVFRGVLKWRISEEGVKGVDKQEVIDLYKTRKDSINGETN